jgi:hypothetical protein
MCTTAFLRNGPQFFVLGPSFLTINKVLIILVQYELQDILYFFLVLKIYCTMILEKDFSQIASTRYEHIDYLMMGREKVVMYKYTGQLLKPVLFHFQKQEYFCFGKHKRHDVRTI